ncbi:tetratricopeptide repeat protein [Fimbriiglobus ruber]|uniref:TPR repeat n=1 Tax=Fimbriiglobus ruber TaxID=1908690 RepID=A0A225DXE9_9BACT|nr:tetratricopeptide repeat protein [Fimbriiglobus ruber]OWK43198.1 TPR repeat [Fimbriiglobus ruber]
MAPAPIARFPARSPAGGVNDPAGPDALRARAETATAAGRWDDAIADCTTAVEADFNLLVVVSARILAVATRGDATASRVAARQIDALQTSLTQSYLLRGTTHARAGRDDRACADFTHVLRLVPDHAGALVARGDAYRRQEQYDLAKADYVAATRHEPTLAVARCGLGEVALHLGDFAAAVTDFTTAIRLDPEPAAPYLGRGRAVLELGDLPAARADFDRALARAPESATAHYYRGLCLARANDSAAALEDFGRALELDATLAPAYLARGETHRTVGALETALADLDEYLRRDPASVAGLTMRGEIHQDRCNHDCAVADFDAALGYAPDGGDLYVRRARALCLKAGQTAAADSLAEALRLYPKASARGSAAQEPIGILALAGETAPSPGAVAFERGLAYQQDGDADRALAAYDDAILLDPDYAAAYRERGQLHRQAGRGRQALDDFSTAIRLAPDEPETYLRRGSTYLAVGQLDRATADFDAALRLDPDLAAAYANRGLVRVKQGDPHAAAADATAALRLDPALTRAYFVRGAARAALGRHADAVDDFDHLLELDPADALAYNERGVVLADMGEYERAVADYDRAIELKPAFVLARFNRAVALRASGNPGAAAADLDEVIRRQPQSAHAYYHRGLAAFDLGDHPRAAADLIRASQLDPDLDGVSEQLERVQAASHALADAAALVTTPEFPAPLQIAAPIEEFEEVTPVSSSEPPIAPAETLPEATAVTNEVEPVEVDPPPAPAPRTSGPTGGSCPDCPECRRPGKVAWVRPGQSFYCSGCRYIFKFHSSGAPVKVSRRAERKMAARTDPARPPLVARALARGWRGGLAATVLLACGVLVFTLRPAAAHPLRERSRDLTRAWLAQDVTRMSETTDPDMGKKLERWLVRNPPPEFARGNSSGAVSIEASVERTDGKSADVALKLSIADANGSPLVAVIYQHWIEKNGRWYFAPDTKETPPRKSGPTKKGK